ncbi:MAG: tRNA epoxyqueuosine(34) reductase QueG [Planctomycetes bacterium]|nr:tRNA epoxyqueuosine(34) reductase QueG [Planctomycetota bacterium]
MNDPPAPLAPYRFHAEAHGFDLVGATTVDPPESAPRFLEWLAQGHHAEMSWLERQRDRILDPAVILEGGRSILTLAVSHVRPPASFRGGGRVARYAASRDYHNVLGRALDRLGKALVGAGLATRFRGLVDAGPALERALAARSGLGFIGRSANLLHHRHGPWVFLAELWIDRELETTDRRAPGSCGTCTACVDQCPTGAIIADRVVDARRCISYWTIEHRGPMPRSWRARLGPWVFGCDVCSEVCPFGTEDEGTRMDFGDHPALDRSLEDLFLIPDQDAFLRLFAGSALRRPRRDGLLRNAAIALANLGKEDAIPTLRRALSDPHPVVRSHAGWALGMLGRSAERDRIDRARRRELDPVARQDLALTLSELDGS